ncbi:uncharacterized protein LOC115962255 isoform X1 [Quercus lobata]|uniref:FHA domain-containing protein n=2 Tax=Quercus lobata TaxID=97700 RepID=A0A7N2ML76_QUELO|nr:uncharacterized protein LOC115962255 isoform X1 [Quercus lobata]
MGALAPVSTWNPEDDLLLKNAVEAGASLESLAKGAVQFSRRFTVRELQDRWHSLLYDPVISAEASPHMIAIERSGSTLPSKLNRFGNSKENKSVCGKRKADSVRSYYYALLKRLCNDPLNSMDLSFFVAPGDCNYIANGNEPLPGDCMPGDTMPNHCGLEGSNMDIMHHVFPQNLMDGGAATADTAANGHDFHPGLQLPGEEDFYIEQDNIHNEIPHPFEENLPFTVNGSVFEEYVQPKQLLAHSMLEADDLGLEPSSTFDQINNDPGHICSEFEGNQVFSSPMSECGASFHNLEFSSPLHEMSIWGPVEGLAASSMPDVGLGEKDLHTGDRFELLDDDFGKNATTSGYDVHSDFKLGSEMPCDGLRSPTASAEGYLAELSNSLLNFTNEEELLAMGDGKEAIDKSYYDGLSSLLSNSQNDVCQNHIPSITEPETSVALDTDIKKPPIACSGELEENRGPHYDDGCIAHVSGTQMLSSLSHSNPQFPDLCDKEVICCTLNTEDPDIPCNDDFIPPKQFSPSSVSFVSQNKFQEANNPNSSTINDILVNQRARERGVLMKREGKNLGECHVSSKNIGPHVLPEPSVNHPIGGSGVKFELPNSDSPLVASKGVGIAYGGTDQLNSASLSTDALKEETKGVSPVKHLSHNQMDSFIKKPALVCDSFKGCTQTNASGIKLELDVPAMIQDYQSTHAEVASVDIVMSEPVVKPTTSDQEEAPVESDDDVPHYSDIEAMILDMDLDPEDQDLFSNEEVLRYQNEETKRAIIRLEQGAHSYMQRAIASHGAFAVLYGRHSKHYIKKPEVLLGRATEDIIVDIDLGREGRANKISRRQAIIEMDKRGSFCLKNLGKCSISVNNKEVGPGQSLSLISSCLIEIRGMPFVFETSQTCVKQYLDNITKNNQL